MKQIREHASVGKSSRATRMRRHQEGCKLLEKATASRDEGAYDKLREREREKGVGGRRLNVVAVDRVGSLDVIYRDFAQAFNKGPTSAHQENGITRTGKVKRWAAKSGPEWQILHIGRSAVGSPPGQCAVAPSFCHI
jgi:hypothetical protein